MSELEEYFYNWQQVNKIIIRGEHGGSAYRNTAKKMELINEPINERATANTKYIYK